MAAVAPLRADVKLPPKANAWIGEVKLSGPYHVEQGFVYAGQGLLSDLVLSTLGSIGGRGGLLTNFQLHHYD